MTAILLPSSRIKAHSIDPAIRMLGVDTSERMLEIARKRTDDDARISWRVDDAERLASCESGAFDRATCQLALMDIADLSGIRGRAGNYHRTLSAYLNSLLAADFKLDDVLEPEATSLLAEQQRVYQRVPIFFAARAVAS